ncbi:hypothetical protein BDZ94DRAFT_1271186 [Collybia nuda]|uniref:F-box domain-containing protein n=1 Tax=Collybia nuda TaxID=64659 RepID=A0A9P5XWA6_9AGAR|nr:hypothetical protein BDZ94DRAFT_1271186 [Collybia nuda]
MDTPRRASDASESTGTSSGYRSTHPKIPTILEVAQSNQPPIKCLPVEVLEEIFLLCLQTESIVFRRIHDLLREAPSLLCLVCSDWAEGGSGNSRVSSDTRN